MRLCAGALSLCVCFSLYRGQSERWMVLRREPTIPIPRQSHTTHYIPDRLHRTRQHRFRASALLRSRHIPMPCCPRPAFPYHPTYCQPFAVHQRHALRAQQPPEPVAGLYALEGADGDPRPTGSPRTCTWAILFGALDQKEDLPNCTKTSLLCRPPSRFVALGYWALHMALWVKPHSEVSAGPEGCPIAAQRLVKRFVAASPNWRISPDVALKCAPQPPSGSPYPCFHRLH